MPDTEERAEKASEITYQNTKKQETTRESKHKNQLKIKKTHHFKAEKTESTLSPKDNSKIKI
ncbi:hypothetical protein [Pseudoalteromonas ardens]|uniref:hypothetical protein n=1 Tax=Pseudoalteromonas ardens TaxID=3048490 RepID=UPI0024C361BC|nr:hypothetical protein [Pseudoalteromonas sp. R96]MDK1312340.1 hypothetical protein [Pseudoalteromonas sp. R96]